MMVGVKQIHHNLNQKKLNQYNEFNRTPKSNGYFAINQPIIEDGVIGPETKSAIYDFEQNNP